MMASDFTEDVQEILGPTLERLGFALTGADDSPDPGGRRQHIVYYQSDDCKLQLYESPREGETNCMIAPLDALDSFGLRTDKWQFLTRFSKTTQILWSG